MLPPIENWPAVLGLLVAAYVLGCINTGYYLVRFKTGRDVRDCGSGSAGARNVGRLLGSSGFLLTLGFDGLKGAGVIWVARQVELPDAWSLVAVAAVLVGHVWPAQLRFRGGKGIAPFLGGLLAYDPTWALGFGALVGVCWLAWRKLTPAALSALPLLPLVAAWRGSPPEILAALALLGSIILIAHRANIRNEIAPRFPEPPLVDRPEPETSSGARHDERGTPDRF